jgi:hypothetical protein
MTDSRNRWIWTCVLAAALTIGGTARANVALVPCAPGTGFDYGPNPHVICGGAEGHGDGNGTIFNASPDPFAFFLSGAGGSMGVAGGGVGGVAASAAGAGTFGTIHLFAYADNGQFFDPNSAQKGSAFGTAEIVFVDGGTVAGPIGSQVDIRFTVSMEGAFTGIGEGDFEFNVFDGALFLGTRRAFLYSGQPAVFQTLDVTVNAGDTLFFSMDMLVQAGSTNDGGLIRQSVADASNTGRVFLDVLTPDADFVSNSGTNYSSAATAPEPDTALLFVGVLVAMAMYKARTEGR